MRYLTTSLATMIVASALATPAPAAMIVIDDFTTFIDTAPDPDEFTISLNALADGVPSVASATGIGPGILGGSRSSFLELTAAGAPLAAQNVSLSIGFGFKVYAESSQADGEFLLRYDGDSDPGLQYALGGIDATDGGVNTGFVLEGVVLDIGMQTFTMEVILHSGGGTESSTATVTFTEDIVTAAYFFPFTSLVGDVDLTDIDAIELRGDSGSGMATDLQITRFSFSTPEPSSIMLLGMGLAGMACGRYRKRRNADLSAG